MEQLTQKETETLRRLQAKQKRIERAEHDFWKAVDERRDEVLQHLGVLESGEAFCKGPRNYGEVTFDASASSGTELLFDAEAEVESNESDAEKWQSRFCKA